MSCGPIRCWIWRSTSRRVSSARRVRRRWIGPASPGGRLSSPPACTACGPAWPRAWGSPRSEEHTSELQSLMRISYAVFCLKKKKHKTDKKGREQKRQQAQLENKKNKYQKRRKITTITRGRSHEVNKLTIRT